jgi:ATP-dependent Clp protease ATP-binding subunit ClpB
MNKFDSIVMGAIDIAHTEALKRKNNELAPAHLFWGLLSNPQSYTGKSLKHLKAKTKEILDTLPRVGGDLNIEQLRANAKFSEWVTYASGHAIQSGRSEVSEPDLLKYINQIMPELELSAEDLSKESEGEEEKPSFLVNLNELAEQGKLDPVIGRTKEIRAVMEILGRRGKNNPVLVGPAGVGKTAIVEGLADAIVKNQVPDMLVGKEIYSLDLGQLMAGTKFRGEFEERLQTLIKYIKEKAGTAILFIDEIHQLVGAGKTDGAMDAANLLKPALARGELHCIGATTENEYQKYILGDSALDRRFRSVPVKEPSKEDSVEILMGVKEKLEAHHGVKISEDAIYSAVWLSDQYITDKNLPDKAIDLVDEATSALKLSAEAMPSKLAELEAEIRSKKVLAQVENNKSELLKEIESLESDFLKQKELWEKELLSMKRMSELKNQLDRYKFELGQAERNADFETASKLKYSLIPEVEGQLNENAHDFQLNKNHIANIITRQTGIPVEKILKEKQNQILDLENFLNKRVFGQKDSLHEISEVLITSHAGLKDETRPLGSFMLKGPSGVGKTETAKSLAKFLFDREDKLVRLDMSEFSEKHSVAKLIGAPAGYVGYEEGGILTEKIRNNPYSVILFDEIEKAHPDFSDILLQILDDGRLTDNKGRTINFQNTVILLTTNSKSIELDFKPEVIGRLDAVLDYNALDKTVMESLVEKQVYLLNERLKSKGPQVTLKPELISFLCENGYDERYGARPLASLFNKYVIRPLSRKMVSGELEQRNFELGWDKQSKTVSIN